MQFFHIQRRGGKASTRNLYIFDSKGIEKARTLHNHTEYIIIEIECPKAAKAWLCFSCEKLVGRLVWEVSLLIASSPGGEDHCRCKVWAEGARTD